MINLFIMVLLTSCAVTQKTPLLEKAENNNIQQFNETQANSADAQEKVEKFESPSKANDQDVEQPDVEYTIVLGRLLGQDHLPDIHPESCLEDGLPVCINVYYLFNNEILQVLSGDDLSGSVTN